MALFLLKLLKNDNVTNHNYRYILHLFMILIHLRSIKL